MMNSQETLDANSDLEDELSNLAGTVDDDRMRELNGRVNIDGKKDKDVAIEIFKRRRSYRLMKAVLTILHGSFPA